jgi:protein-S-isoprenylcysteine O-methyltransferase Ste14
MSHNRNAVQVAGNFAYAIFFLLMFIFAILFYDSAKLTAALYSGWLLFAFGVCMVFLASQSRRRAREKTDPSKNVVIETGMYAYVRHPEFFSQFFVVFGLVFISQYWVSIVVGAVLIAFLWLAIIDEEKRNKEKFGEAYIAYMQRVPRINLIAGMIRQMRQKRRIQAPFKDG